MPMVVRVAGVTSGVVTGVVAGVVAGVVDDNGISSFHLANFCSC
jgi:hypothetical protein